MVTIAYYYLFVSSKGSGYEETQMLYPQKDAINEQKWAKRHKKIAKTSASHQHL